MNPQQMALQIRDQLATVAWALASAELVFGENGARVVAGFPTSDLLPPVLPFVLVGVDSGTADPYEPAFITQDFTITIAASVHGDPLGENAVRGGPVTELGVSAGRGVLELAERARSAVQDLTSADGAKIMLSMSATVGPTSLDDMPHLALHSQQLTALCTSALHYTAPQEIAHDGNDWTWTGTQCSNRFDFKQYRLVHKTGSTPSTPADGTTVYTGTTASFTGVATSGETYVAFADYSARQQTGVVEGSSSAEVGSYKAIA